MATNISTIISSNIQQTFVIHRTTNIDSVYLGDVIHPPLQHGPIGANNNQAVFIENPVEYRLSGFTSFSVCPCVCVCVCVCVCACVRVCVFFGWKTSNKSDSRNSGSHRDRTLPGNSCGTGGWCPRVPGDIRCCSSPRSPRIPR